MFPRFGFALALGFLLSASASAQVVRFETTVGDFDMVLNPTHNPLLQAHVDNMLGYVENQSYRASWINRADSGFVLQMGGFYAHTRRPPPTIDSIRSVRAFQPVAGEPGISGLSNTVGTVSLALPGDGMGGTNQDAGTSSFFINLKSNAFLDPDFTVFAAIPDMSVVNQIMALSTIDRTTDSSFGAGPGNLAFTDVPVAANGFQVFIKRAFVVEDAMSVAQAMSAVQPIMQQSIQAFGDGEGSAPLLPPAVPEPTSLLLGLAGLLPFVAGRRRRTVR